MMTLNKGEDDIRVGCHEEFSNFNDRNPMNLHLDKENKPTLEHMVIQKNIKEKDQS
jgi:hypothetical protein